MLRYNLQMVQLAKDVPVQLTDATGGGISHVPVCAPLTDATRTGSNASLCLTDATGEGRPCSGMRPVADATGAGTPCSDMRSIYLVQLVRKLMFRRDC